MSISIVIPHYDHWEYTHALLSDLFQHERGNIDEVVLVDNGGTDPVIGGGQKFWKEQFKEHSKFRVISLRENVGFLLAANLGLQEAEGTIRALISNDVRIKGQFVGAIDNAIFKSRILVGQKLYMTNTGWNNFEGHIFPYLEGFLLAAETRAWEELDYLDTDFAPQDYEDVALSTKAVSMGYQLVPLNLPHIEHKGAGTLGYSPEREKITLANREKFRQKWVTP